MIVDSGAESVSRSQTFLDKRDKVERSVATGNRWRRLDPRRDRELALVAASCHGCAFNPYSQSVSSALPEVRKMDISTRNVPKVMEC